MYFNNNITFIIFNNNVLVFIYYIINYVIKYKVIFEAYVIALSVKKIIENK